MTSQEFIGRIRKYLRIKRERERRRESGKQDKKASPLETGKLVDDASLVGEDSVLGSGGMVKKTKLGDMEELEGGDYDE